MSPFIKRGQVALSSEMPGWPGILEIWECLECAVLVAGDHVVDHQALRHDPDRADNKTLCQESSSDG